MFGSAFVAFADELNPPGDPWLPTVAGVVPRVRAATPIEVYRMTGPGAFQPLPFLNCMGVWRYDGPTPSMARFRYAFDFRATDSPQSLEEALDTSSALPEVVNPGDQLVVFAVLPGGLADVPIFHGEALDFGGIVDGQAGREEAWITAYGIEWRCWDEVHPGALMRQGPDFTVVDDVETDLVAHFNPEGKANCSPVGSEADLGAGKKACVFVDPASTNGQAIPWTLPRAARHVVYRLNATEPFVRCPDDQLFDILTSREPITGATFYDPNDPTTYNEKDILAPDKPIKGKDWPSTLWSLIRDKGFSQCWRLSLDSSDDPTTQLDLYVEQAGPAKDVYLQAYGSQLDPQQTNVGAADFARELHDAANEWVVEGALEQFECSFVLAPGYAASATDAASGAALANFKRSAIQPGSANWNKYRLYVLDEDGSGHYAAGSSTLVDQEPPDLSDAIGTPYVHRRRRPIGKLLTKDGSGKALKYQLSYSTNYSGDTPGVWDGTGTWTRITGGFDLLPDRVGVWVNVDNPNSWAVGNNKALKGVEQMASAGSSNFKLRLTVVVESDQAVTGVASRQASSPLAQPVRRTIDARDRYFRQWIQPSSEFNTTGALINVRDDTDNAKAEASAIRFATQAGVLSGTVRIPRFTAYYEVGDRIRQVAGRNLGLRTDGGGSSNAPVYPVVCGVHWDFSDGQRTELILSDAAKGRARYERAARSGLGRRA